jgi:hypothetical protein
MDYKKYIDLGFNRTDMECQVEFNQTGYGGFALEKKINKKILISVESGSLDKPKLYIKKRNLETYHIIHISTDAVLDLLLNDSNINIYTAV